MSETATLRACLYPPCSAPLERRADEAVANFRKRRYCDIQCYGAHKTVHPRARTCFICGEGFWVESKDGGRRKRCDDCRGRQYPIRRIAGGE